MGQTSGMGSVCGPDPVQGWSMGLFCGCYPACWPDPACWIWPCTSLTLQAGLTPAAGLILSAGPTPCANLTLCTGFGLMAARSSTRGYVIWPVGLPRVQIFGSSRVAINFATALPCCQMSRPVDSLTGWMTPFHVTRGHRPKPKHTEISGSLFFDLVVFDLVMYRGPGFNQSLVTFSSALFWTSSHMMLFASLFAKVGQILKWSKTMQINIVSWTSKEVL